MNQKRQIKWSKFLSKVLRHDPEYINLQVSPEGWVVVTHLLEQMASPGWGLHRGELAFVVENEAKHRFSFSEDKRLIRATQGHSFQVDLGYFPKTPPSALYHGTTNKNRYRILKLGILKQERQQVHLSTHMDTAIQVGSRHGEAWVVAVNARQMALDGWAFYESNNGIWLTDEVPPKYLQEMRD